MKRRPGARKVLQSRVFNKETRGGRIQKIDLLENQAVDNVVVVLSVVLDEVKNRNRSLCTTESELSAAIQPSNSMFSPIMFTRTLYVQVMERETANDHNDREHSTASEPFGYENSSGQLILGTVSLDILLVIIAVMLADPPGCKDIDDALHCTSLQTGTLNLVLLVLLWMMRHQKEAYLSTLLSAGIDMLPKPLTEDICSLRADVERLVFSVIWEMSPVVEIISTRITMSIIKSSAALSYVEAQARMDDRRIDRGALTLASAEVKFQIDTETHDPLDIGMYQIREANQMVEEFMLAANVSVSEQILKQFPSCSLFRRHPTPTREMLEPLLRTAAAIGLSLDVSSSKALTDSLDRAVGEDPYFNKLIRILATRCMTKAVYFCSGDLSPPEYLHYGLAAPLYTHFTSPTRRYADVFVHRLLATSLGIYKLPLVFQDRPQLTSVAVDKFLLYPPPWIQRFSLFRLSEC
ncbi:hypothetical protein Bca52824_094363 [Brassica carinata]|uniref:RNB domain-containing protein n=1 Tax=Brassica carinata TaxID=52824 RepID=A0A8X7P465_BRACI|nr:hypothetical protein Bca52824_094363 [Brassica carinata]